MSENIVVTKQSVAEFLSSGKEKTLIIPGYQRPYAWTIEQVEALFEDLWEFASTTDDSDGEGAYFLGCIVCYENEIAENKIEQEIVDGQQRITSPLLLLRAVYAKLTGIHEPNSDSEDVSKCLSALEKVIGEKDNRTGEGKAFTSAFLTSQVIDDDANEILHQILATGETDADATDSYSQNYRHLQMLIDEHQQQGSMLLCDFATAVLNQSILLPIKATKPEMALTIFSTLNDRGLPLADVDIFKAAIYNKLDQAKRQTFIRHW